MEAVPDLTVSEEEAPRLEGSIEEAKVACMAGMLMCLSREQRLVYIVGEVFQIEHKLAGQIFDIAPATFRKRLSRARNDLYQWMHKKCGLVNKANPCRCRNKTRHFVNEGLIDPENHTWLANYQKKIFELSKDTLDETIIARDQIYTKLYREHPFKVNLKADEVYEEILNHQDFKRFMDLE